MHTARLVPVALLVALLAGACGGGDDSPSDVPTDSSEPTPTVTVTETATPTPTQTQTAFACSNQEAAVSDESLRQPGRLTGELDDDGIKDNVYLVVDPAGEQECQAFVVVESDGELRSTPIAVPDIPFDLGFPRLIGLPLIDDRAGAEIVVGVHAGASTQFAAVFTSVEGQIAPVLREDAAGLADSLLAFGGSVGHQDAFDCAPEFGPGVVVVSGASPTASGARFRYVRRFFVFETPTVVAEDESLREEGTIRFNRFDSLHEFPNAPFGSCPTGEVAG